MLKWLIIILWIGIIKTLSSQPITNENVREYRQLNFGDCCPCPHSEENFKDQDVLGSRLEPTLQDDSCPCRPPLDSESASSIFRPAMRAVDTFTRPRESTGDPKPLLKPEVGLASSVLETLREVTDQEYQEALERDAARSVIKEMERNNEDEVPRNIVNIILQPKDDQVDDPIPEASHIQETRCIHPPLGRANILEQRRLKAPARNINNGLLRNKYFDMANSASNIQELAIPPLKNSLLEDLKLKSDLLKMKLFPSIRNVLKETKSVNAMNEDERDPGGDSSHNIQALRVPNFKLASIVDLLKASKQKNLYSVSPSNLKDTDSYKDDFKASPSENNYLTYRENQKKPHMKAFYKIEKNSPIKNANTKVISASNGNPETENKGIIDNSDLKLALFTDASSNKKILSGGDGLRKNECIVNGKQLNEVLPNDDIIPIEDVASSPSEIVQIEKSVDNPQIGETADDMITERGTDNNVDIENEDKSLNSENLKGETYMENIDDTKSVQADDTEISNGESKSCDMTSLASSPSEIVQIGKSVGEIGETADDMIKGNKIDNDVDIQHKDNTFNIENLEGEAYMENTADGVKVHGTEINNDENKSCDMEDSESGASSSNIQLANTQLNEQKKISFDNSNRAISSERHFDNNQALNYGRSELVTTENGLTTIDRGNIEKTNTLSNIKADILKTFENFKKANERIHEKLRSNVHNALQLDFVKNKPVTEIESTTFSTITNDVTEDISKIGNNLSMQDLQEMSDHILELSEKSNADSSSDVNTNNTNGPNNFEDNKASESKNVPAEIPLSEITKPIGSSLINTEEVIDRTDFINEEIKDETSDKLLDSKSKKETCSDVVPTTDQPTGADVIPSNDHENEMMSEASSPIVNSIRQFNQDFNSQPKADIDLKEFLINLRSSVSDILNNNNNEDINFDTSTNTYHDVGNENTNSILFNNKPKAYLKETSSRFNDPRNIDSLNLRKNNDLNSFQAKVPSPDSLNIKAIPTILSKSLNSNKLFNDNPEKTSASNVLQNPLESPSISNFNAVKNAKQSFEPRMNLKKSNLLQDILPRSGSMTSLSENFKSRTEEALRNIQETFDSTLRKPHLHNPNNIFGETITKPDVLGTISKTSNDISKKLQAFNSDLKDKLLMMSQKSSDILPPRDISSSLIKNKINDLHNGLKSTPAYNPQAKTNLLKTKNNSLKPIISQSSSIRKGGLSKPLLHQNLGHSPHRLLSSDLFDNKPIAKLRPGLKTPLSKTIKRKPFTESKVSFSFTTTSAPELLKSASNQKTLSKLTPTLRSPVNLPKSLTPIKTPLQKRLELKSKFKDPKLSASETYASHAAFPKQLDILKSSNKFLPKEESKLRTPIASLIQDTSSGGLFIENIPDIPKRENSALSKLISAASVNKNNKLFNNRNDILKSSSPGDAQSASSNMNIASSSVIEKPLKENVSYKCKMVCFEDVDDSK